MTLDLKTAHVEYVEHTELMLGIENALAKLDDLSETATSHDLARVLELHERLNGKFDQYFTSRISVLKALSDTQDFLNEI